MVDDSGRSSRDILAFVLACATGGAATGLVLGLMGGLVPPLDLDLRIYVGLIGVAALLAVARDSGLVRISLPENRRQVRHTVRYLSNIVGDVSFGFELGSGVRTYMPATAPYLAGLAIVLVVPTLAVGILTGAAFGLGRGLVVFDRSLRKNGDRWDYSLQRMRPVLPLLVLPVVVWFLIWVVVIQQPG